MLPYKWGLWHFSIVTAVWADCSHSASSCTRSLCRSRQQLGAIVFCPHRHMVGSSCNSEASQSWWSQGLRHFLRQLGAPWNILRRFASSVHSSEGWDHSSAASSNSSLHFTDPPNQHILLQQYQGPQASLTNVHFSSERCWSINIIQHEQPFLSCPQRGI